MPEVGPRHLTRRAFLGALGGLALGVRPRASAAVTGEARTLAMLNWDNYMDPAVLDGFGEETGITVVMDLFTDDEDLFRRIAAGNPDGYDLIVPSDRNVDRMLRGGLLLPIERARLGNFDNLDPGFRSAAFDRDRRYSIPYMWGTVGIGYRRSAVDGVPDSWRWLFDSDRHARRIALISDPQILIQMALKYLGYSLRTLDPRQIREAEALIVRQKPRIAAFPATEGQDLLAAGDVDLVLEWNGDILQVMRENDDLAYTVPREGSMLWQDCLCIPKGARDPGAAHALIDHLLDAQVGARLASAIRYATPNQAALALMPASYREDPAIFPEPEVFSRCEVASYQGELPIRLYEQAWARIEAA